MIFLNFQYIVHIREYYALFDVKFIIVLHFCYFAACSLFMLITFFITAITLLIYVHAVDKPLTPINVFVSFAVFQQLQVPLALLPMIITSGSAVCLFYYSSIFRFSTCALYSQGACWS